MSNVLDNGDVIPSQYGLRSTNGFDTGSYFGNIELRRGEVVKIIYPDEKGSVSKKFIEYDIYLEIRQNGTGNGELLHNVVLFNLLGSLADRASWTLRAAEKPVVSNNKNDPKAVGSGSKVLVMFVHGEGKNPVIIGGLRDPEDQSEKGDKKSEAGHHSEHIFNGLATEIDKNGAFTITFNGPTKNDGKLDTDKVKDEATGTFIQINKDGNGIVSDKDGKNSVTVNHKDKKVVIKRDEAFELGDATDKMLLGESFRNAEKEKNNKIKGYAKVAKNLVQQAAIQMNTAGGAVAGPFMAAACGSSLIAASQLLQQVATQFEQIAQAIDDYEQAAGQKNSFLSKKNKAD